MLRPAMLACAAILLCVTNAATLNATNTIGPVGTRQYADGVNPPPHQRAPGKKIVWAYAGAATQGDFGQVYHPQGMVNVDDVLNTAVNQISFIANVDVNGSTGWFQPGSNNSGGCGQYQTYELPFGYECKRTSQDPHNHACDDSDSLDTFHGNLKRLHDAGVTLTITLGSWCTELPVLASDAWQQSEFDQFVDYFREIRQTKFGGYLDGVDFDWEGYCSAGCLKGTCSCGWDDATCGTKTPEQLAAGVFYTATNTAIGADGTEIKQSQQFQCWVLPTQHTIQVMTGITAAMKKAGFVVTLVPMSTSLYSGDDSTSVPTSRNEYVKWRKQPVGDGGKTVDLLDLADGVMLQWYSGFDASLCKNSNDPSKCACDNTPDADYPNMADGKKDLVLYPWQTLWNLTGNAFPTTFPLRCQACGKNVLRKGDDGKWGWGEHACAPEGEDWFVPCSQRDDKGANLPECMSKHNNGMQNYAGKHKTQPYWWPKGVEVASKCPRGLDCPDWRYEGETPYKRQLDLLKSISNVVDLAKITIGFETLGVDVVVQMQAYADQALPWSTAPPKKHQFPVPYDQRVYYQACTQNMTDDNWNQDKEMRCGSPVAWQQWGLKFNAKDVMGLEAAVAKQFPGKQLSGIGLFTLDGVMAQDKQHKKRFWCEELRKLNESSYHLPCAGNNCNECGGDHNPVAPTPAPSTKHGDYYVESGDTCFSIAAKECGAGTDYTKAICNAATVCSNLQIGTDVKYDCTLKGTYCN